MGKGGRYEVGQGCPGQNQMLPYIGAKDRQTGQTIDTALDSRSGDGNSLLSDDGWRD